MTQRTPRLVPLEEPSTALRGGANVLQGTTPDRAAVLETLATLQAEVDRLRQRELAQQAAIRRLDDELRRAGEVQRELLPREIPTISGLDIHLVYEPAEVLSGDSYDAIRLDDSRVAFSIADATGHGASAALLSAFVKRSLRGTASGESPSVNSVDPAGVLSRVSRDLHDLQLEECQFVAALYATYDEHTRVLRFARGGTPPPILVRGGRARLLMSEGPLLGAVEEPLFEPVDLLLEPGDALIFHTDGLEYAVQDPTQTGPCVNLEKSDWFRSLGSRPLEEQLAALRSTGDRGRARPRRVDDLTMMALIVQEKKVTSSVESDASAGGIPH